MQDKLKLLVEKIETLSLRERILVLVAVLIALHQAWDSLVWRPMLEQEQRLSAREAQANDLLLQTQVDLKLLTAEANRDPDRQTRQAINNLENQLQAVRQQIDDTSASLVSPTEMARLLEQLLISEASLELLSLQTEDTVPLLAPEDTQVTMGNFQIYRHGFTIEFAGNYMATLRYLQALENLPWRFFWDGVDYEVNEYPGSVVRLRLYTLSLSEGWIGV